MKNKNIVFLVIVLLLLAAIYFFITAQKGKGTIERPKQLTISVDSTLVNEIEIHLPTDTLKLAKKNDLWMIESPIKEEADQNAIVRIISAFATVGINAEISSSPEMFSKYNVDEQNARYIKFKQSNGVTIELLVGKNGPAGQSFVRIPKDNAVYLTTANISSPIRRRTDDYRNRMLFNVNQNDISLIDVRSPFENMYLAKSAQGWKVGKTADSNMLDADSSRVESQLRTVKNMRASSFVDDPDSIAKLDFNNPPITMDIELSGGKKLHVDGILATADSSKVLLKKQGTERPIFVASAGTVKRLAKDLEFMTTAPPPPQSNPQGMQGMGGGNQEITPEMQRQIQEMLRKQNSGR